MKIFGRDFGKRIKNAVVTPMTAAGNPALVPSAIPGTSWFGQLIQESFPGAWQRNLVIGVQEITAFGAVYACISRIATDVSLCQPRIMEIADGIWEEAPDSPHAMVLKKPNRYQTRIQFLSYWVTSKLLYGNAYILKEREAARGIVRALYPLDPRTVKAMVAPDGEVYYQLSGDYLSGVDGKNDPVPASEIIHDRGVTLWHPLCGVSPIYACSASASQGIRMQSNSEKFFENMSRPSGQLTAPGMIDEATLRRLKADWDAGYNGANAGRVFITGNGLKYEPMTIPFHDSQLIEQLKYSAEDVARVFHVPRHKIGIGVNQTFSNIGALNQEYLTDCLRGYIEDIELLLDEGLELPKNRGTELDTETLTRLDKKSQAETNEIEMRSAAMTPDEARFIMNRKPIAGGDAAYLQQQNYSLAALAKRDAQEDPFGTAPPPPAARREDDDEDEEQDDAEKLAAKLIAKFTEATYAAQP